MMPTRRSKNWENAAQRFSSWASGTLDFELLNLGSVDEIHIYLAPTFADGMAVIPFAGQSARIPLFGA